MLTMGHASKQKCAAAFLDDYCGYNKYAAKLIARPTVTGQPFLTYSPYNSWSHDYWYVSLEEEYHSFSYDYESVPKPTATEYHCHGVYSTG